MKTMFLKVTAIGLLAIFSLVPAGNRPVWAEEELTAEDLDFEKELAAEEPVDEAPAENEAAKPEEAQEGSIEEDKLLSSFEAAVAEPAAKTAAAAATGSQKGKDVPIKFGDKLKIKIYPEDQYVKGGDMEVSSEGNITLPLVGKVEVVGKTPVEAERVIAKIIDQDYLVNPEVVIEVAMRSQGDKRTVILFGQVRKPGPYDFTPSQSGKRMTLLEVISMAGGFTEIANIKKIKIVRKLGGEKSVINVNGEAVMSGDEPDIELSHGDVITVSESMF
jgi:polysaccharide export outer membrane protein